MSVKNTIAAKAARREAKAERKSANAFESNYSSLKNLNMGKTNNSGCATKNPKELINLSALILTPNKSSTK